MELEDPPDNDRQQESAQSRVTDAREWLAQFMALAEESAQSRVTDVQEWAEQVRAVLEAGKQFEAALTAAEAELHPNEVAQVRAVVARIEAMLTPVLVIEAEAELATAKAELTDALRQWDSVVDKHGLLPVLDRDQTDAALLGGSVGFILGLVVSIATFYSACRWVLTGEWLASSLTSWELLQEPFVVAVFGINEETTRRATLLTAVVALLVATISTTSTFHAARSTPAKARLKAEAANKVFVHEWKLDPTGWRALVSADQEVRWVPVDQITPAKQGRWFRGLFLLVFRENLAGGAFRGLILGVACSIVGFLAMTGFVLNMDPPDAVTITEQWFDQVSIEPSRAEMTRLRQTLVLGLLTSLAFGVAIALQWRDRHRRLTHAVVTRHGRQYLIRVLAVRDIAGGWHAVIEAPQEPKRRLRVLLSMLLILPLFYAVVEWLANPGVRGSIRRVLPLETLEHAR